MSSTPTKRNKTLFQLIDKIKENKKLQYVVICVLALISLTILLFNNNTNSDIVSNHDCVNSYVSDLEKKLSETLSKVEGAGKVSVIITVQSGMQTILASEKTSVETSSGTEIKETPIIVNGKTVTIKELYPNISGVLIVAEGANNILVQSRLQQATTSLLNIKLNQIEILTMK